MEHTPHNLTLLCVILLIFAIIVEVLAFAVLLKDRRKRMDKTLDGYQGKMVLREMMIIIASSYIITSVIAVVLIYYANILLKKTKEKAKLGLARFSIAIGTIFLFVHTFLFIAPILYFFTDFFKHEK